MRKIGKCKKLFSPTSERGFAIPPRQRMCIGEACPIRDLGERCMLTDHHLYFPGNHYKDNDLYERLRNNGLSIVRMARCRHNSSYENAWHNWYVGTNRPKKRDIPIYLHEAAIIEDMANCLHVVLTNSLSLAGADKRKLVMDEDKLASRQEHLHEAHVRFVENMQLTRQFEIIPPSIVGREVVRLCTDLNELPLAEAYQATLYVAQTKSARFLP